MAGSVGDRDEVMSEINVTPFVDIVLVLLIILMVTSAQIVRSAITVELPKAASGGDAVESTLNVVLTKDSKLFVNGKESTEDQLVAVIKTEKASNPKLQAVIAADQGIPYGSVMRVIDLVKTNGVKSFALNIDREAQAAKP
ncbi:biopolymer transporter ExbD [Myxococcota bacterium]|nr:biopolymer transporter ExbD [Myxococcota bacterium]